MAEDVAPVDGGGDGGADLFAEFGGDVAPAVGLCVGGLGGAFDDGADLAFDEFLEVVGDGVPSVVGVERVEVAEEGVGGGAWVLLLFLFDLLFDLLEVPFGGLVLGEGGDEGGDGHGSLFLGGVFTAFGTLGEDARDEAAGGEGDVGVAGGVVGDDGVDGQVGGDVPHLGWGFTPGGEVAEDEVVELVGEDATDLGVGHGFEEVGVPVEGDVVELGVVGDGGGG